MKNKKLEMMREKKKKQNTIGQEEEEKIEKILKLGRKNKWINRFGVKFDSEEGI